MARSRAEVFETNENPNETKDCLGGVYNIDERLSRATGTVRKNPARNCWLLLASRKRDADREKSRFCLANRVSFEMKSDVLKSMIWES
jgi:hypothetical protein